MVEKWAKCDLRCFVGINAKPTALILKDIQDLILSAHDPETQTYVTPNSMLQHRNSFMNTYSFTEHRKL